MTNATNNTDAAFAQAIAALLTPLAKLVASELADRMAQAAPPPTQGSGKRFYSVGELAEELGISEALVYAMIRRKEIDVLEFGNRKVLNINDVIASGKIAVQRRDEAERLAIAGMRGRRGRPPGRKTGPRINLV